MLMNSNINPKRHRFDLLKILKLSILVIAVIPYPIFAQSVFLEDDQSGYGISFSVANAGHEAHEATVKGFGVGISSKRVFDVGLSVQIPSGKEDPIWGYSFDMALYVLRHKQNRQPLSIAAILGYGYTGQINTVFGGISNSLYLGLGDYLSIVPTFSLLYTYNKREFSSRYSTSIVAVEFDLPLCVKIVKNLKVVLSPGLVYADKQTAKGISIGVLVVDN